MSAAGEQQLEVNLEVYNLMLAASAPVSVEMVAARTKKTMHPDAPTTIARIPTHITPPARLSPSLHEDTLTHKARHKSEHNAWGELNAQDNRHPPQTDQVWDGMRASGVAPDTVSFNTRLKAYCISALKGDTTGERVRELFEKVPGKHDAFSFATIIDWHGKMVEPLSTTSVSPSCHTHSVLAAHTSSAHTPPRLPTTRATIRATFAGGEGSAHVRGGAQGDVEGMEQCWARMLEGGIKPTNVTINTVKDPRHSPR